MYRLPSEEVQSFVVSETIVNFQRHPKKNCKATSQKKVTNSWWIIQLEHDRAETESSTLLFQIIGRWDEFVLKISNLVVDLIKWLDQKHLRFSRINRGCTHHGIPIVLHFLTFLDISTNQLRGVTIPVGEILFKYRPREIVFSNKTVVNQTYLNAYIKPMPQ